MRIGAMKKQTQYKPNLLDAQMNATSCITRPYEVLPPRPRRGYKPNQTQFHFFHSSQPTLLLSSKTLNLSLGQL